MISKCGGEGLFCVVDKESGTSHSFVDGMLLGEARNVISGPVRVVYAKGRQVVKEEGVVVSPFGRKKAGRVLYPLWALKYYLRNFNSGRRPAVFIRNGLVALCIFVIFKRLFGFNFSIFFQSSFPHEEFGDSILVGKVAKILLSISVPNCSKVFVVNNGAVARMRKYSSSVPIHVIPLCCDFEAREDDLERVGPLRFIYVGTFSKKRQLGVVLSAFLEVSKSKDFELYMYGGSEDELIVQYPEFREEISSLLSTGFLVVGGAIDRNEIPRVISECDVGLNLIPPVPMYLESSSTKLGEYLSQRVCVISSKGIPYHDEIHARCDVGWVVDFSVKGIANKISSIIEGGRQGLEPYANACSVAYLNEFQYKSYSYLLSGSL